MFQLMNPWAGLHQLASLAAENAPSISNHDSEQLAGFISDLVQQAGLALDLSSQGVEVDKLEQLAADADKQWTSNLTPYSRIKACSSSTAGLLILLTIQPLTQPTSTTPKIWLQCCQSRACILNSGIFVQAADKSEPTEKR